MLTTRKAIAGTGPGDECLGMRCTVLSFLKGGRDVRAMLFYSLEALLLIFQSRTEAAELMTALKSGGYVITLRDGATDESQKDILFKIENKSVQRQLNPRSSEAMIQHSVSNLPN